MTGTPPRPVTRADILNELAKIAFADVSHDRQGPRRQELVAPADRAASSPAAARMRRHRERRRDGLKCLSIELRATEIDALISRGMLKSDTRNDPSAVRDALYAHLDRTLGTTP